MGITKLEVNSSWFMHGRNNKLAGGLNVHIGSTNVHVMMANSIVKGNEGHYGGNMALFIALFNVNNSRIIIKNSHILEGRATHGGGINILLSEWKQAENNELSLCPSHHGIQNLVLINNTHFRKNSAFVTGGAMMMVLKDIDPQTSIKRKIAIIRCYFAENIADGAAMEILQLSNYITPQLNISIEMCTFENNYTPLELIGPVIDLIAVEVSITDSTFNGSVTCYPCSKQTH